LRVKTYSLGDMKQRDIVNLLNAINMLGFGAQDYRVVYFGSHSKELKVTNQELHWVLKSMSKLRRVKTYSKKDSR
jgi:hypothetical protein